MHPNPAFRKTSRDRNLEFVTKRGFGVLCVNADGGPLISHVPFLVAADGMSADLHLVRSNPIARIGGVQEAVIAVSGPDAYVSPDWYGVDDQVPTWNYVAVHLRGRLEPLPDDRLQDMLDRQSSFLEGRLPKTPWTTAKMDVRVFRKMMRQILPYRMRIDDIQATWKLNQNKPDEVQKRAAQSVAESTLGSD